MVQRTLISIVGVALLLTGVNLKPVTQYEEKIHHKNLYRRKLLEATSLINEKRADDDVILYSKMNAMLLDSMFTECDLGWAKSALEGFFPASGKLNLFNPEECEFDKVCPKFEKCAEETDLYFIAAKAYMSAMNFEYYPIKELDGLMDKVYKQVAAIDLANSAICAKHQDTGAYQYPAWYKNATELRANFAQRGVVDILQPNGTIPLDWDQGYCDINNQFVQANLQNILVTDGFRNGLGEIKDLALFEFDDYIILSNVFCESGKFGYTDNNQKPYGFAQAPGVCASAMGILNERSNQCVNEVQPVKFDDMIKLAADSMWADTDLDIATMDTYCEKFIDCDHTFKGKVVAFEKYISQGQNTLCPSYADETYFTADWRYHVSNSIFCIKTEFGQNCLANATATLKPMLLKQRANTKISLNLKPKNDYSTWCRKSTCPYNINSTLNYALDTGSTIKPTDLFNNGSALMQNVIRQACITLW